MADFGQMFDENLATADPAQPAPAQGTTGKVNPLAASIERTATKYGWSPLDLATVMSYETAGTFDPWKAGPTTKWGQHRGLAQWGEPQAQQYGVYAGMPDEDQVEAVARYLTDRGVKPGASRLDIYSAINAGGVGPEYYGRRDAAAGGAPGTVAEKVAYQMGDHEAKANAFLKGAWEPGAPMTRTALGAGATKQALLIPVDHDPFNIGVSGGPQPGMGPATPDQSSGMKFVDRLLGLGGEERYQTWPEVMVRSGTTAAGDAVSGALQPTAGLRREDFTDIPVTGRLGSVGSQPADEMVGRALDMQNFAMVGGSGAAAVTNLGAGPQGFRILGRTPAEIGRWASDKAAGRVGTEQFLKTADQVSPTRTGPGAQFQDHVLQEMGGYTPDQLRAMTPEQRQSAYRDFAQSSAWGRDLERNPTSGTPDAQNSPAGGLADAGGQQTGLPAPGGAAVDAGGVGSGGPGGAGGLAAATEAAARSSAGAYIPEGLPTKPLTIKHADGTKEFFVPAPLAKAQELAQDYAATAGIDYQPPKTYVPVDPARATRIADAFEQMPHAPDDPKVQAAYKAMIDETVAQMDTVLKAGLKIEFIKPDQADPYEASPRLAHKDVTENNHLWVFPTDTGFGSGAAVTAEYLAANPLLASTKFNIDGKQLLANDVFRIVHDYFGHFKDGNGFRADGEEHAWRSHAAMYSPEARKAMTTETRGQNSWLNYGPKGAANRTAKTADTVFADQKTGLLPDWVMEEGRLDPTPGVAPPVRNLSRTTELDASLPPAAAKAVDAFVGGPHNMMQLVDQGGLTFGMMRPELMENAFSKQPTPEGLQIRQELEQTFAPVREQLRKMYGDKLKLYRVQDTVEPGARPPRNVLSFTSDKKFATEYAGVRKELKSYSEEEIARAVRDFEEKGEVKVGRHTLVNEDGWVQLYSGGEPNPNNHITGYDKGEKGVREYFAGENDTAKFYADRNAEAVKNLKTVDVPVDDIVWATDRFGQNEFIVKTNNADGSTGAVTLFSNRRAVVLPGERNLRALGKPTKGKQTVTPLDKLSPEYQLVQEKRVEKLATEIPGLKGVMKYMLPDERVKMRRDSAAKIVEMFSNFPSAEEMAAVAFAGRAKKGWYRDSAQSLVDIFGIDDAPRFAALLAALSPQNSVEMNAYNALKTWTNWVNAGRPTDKDAILQIMGRSVQGSGGTSSVLDAWKNNSFRSLTAEDPASITLSGPKVNSFMKNLRDEVNEVTNDAWMANYANIDQNVFGGTGNSPDQFGQVVGKSPGYIAMSAAVRNAAAVATKKTGQPWTPAEIQETVWSWAKTIYEKSSEQGMTTTQMLAAGGLTHEQIASTPDFGALFVTGVYRRILEEGGYGRQIEETAAKGAEGRPEGGGRGLDAGDGRRGDARSAEGSGFAQRAFESHLRRAAERLESLRDERIATRAKPVDQQAIAEDLAERFEERAAKLEDNGMSRAEAEAQAHADVYGDDTYIDGVKVQPVDGNPFAGEPVTPVVGDIDFFSNRRAVLIPTDTPQFRNWFGKSAVVDANGAPQRLFHGTTGEFDVFSPERANIDGDLGGGFYFTNKTDDVAQNYATSSGPDITIRIERKAEDFMNEDPDMDSELAYARAREEMGVKHGGATMPVYLKMENPVRIGGKNETFFDFEEKMDAEGEYTGDVSGKLMEFLDALRSRAAEYNVRPKGVDNVVGAVMEKAMDNNGLSASELMKTVKKHDDIVYEAEDDYGNRAGNEVLRLAMKDIGFDGFIDSTVFEKFGKGGKKRPGGGTSSAGMHGMSPDTVHYVVFEPGQIKSATGNSGAFDPKNPSVLFANKRPLIFYSGVERAVAELPLKSAPASQWLGTLKNKQGVKQEELDWIGLPQWLSEQKGNVTKEKVEEFIANNKVELKEIRKGGVPEKDVINHFGFDAADWASKSDMEKLDLYQQYEEEVDWKSQSGGPTKHGGHQMDGDKTNYRELLFQLPGKPAEKKTWSVVPSEDGRVLTVTRSDGVEQGVWTNDGADAMRDAQAHADRLTRGEVGTIGEGFSVAGHWSEPNVLAWGRMNDRAIPRQLTPEEQDAVDLRSSAERLINSVRGKQEKVAKQIRAESEVAERERKDNIMADWRAKKITGPVANRLLEEYQEPLTIKPLQDRLEKLRREEDAIRAAMPEAPKTSTKTLFIEEIQSDWHQQGREKGYATAPARKGTVMEQGEASGKMWWKIQWEDGGFSGGYESRAAAENAMEGRAKMDRVPDAPFKKSWPELVLKRLIREAADGGYDQIAWTPGEVQNKRWSLSKHIDSLRVWPDGDGKYYFEARKGRQDVGADDGKAFTDKELADQIGKELAQRAIDDIAAGNDANYSGLQLEVGGSGMKGFYDKMLVDAANKLGKPFGAKVTTAEVKGVGGSEHAMSGEMAMDALANHPDWLIPRDRRERPEWFAGLESEAREELFQDARAKLYGKDQKVWVMPITPELRDAAIGKGFPLFMLGVPVVRVEHDPFAEGDKEPALQQ